MRRLAWVLMLTYSFAIPWEYSLDLGAPLGNIARIAGLLVVVVLIPAVLQAGRIRTPGPVHWLALALYLWFCCSYFWSIEPAATLERMRAYAQVMMVVLFAWELTETEDDLRDLMRAYVAGSLVLAVLTFASFMSPAAAGQIRFAAEGQDPNDAARFLDLGFPLAALLFAVERRWWIKWLALAYFRWAYWGCCCWLRAAGWWRQRSRLRVAGFCWSAPGHESFGVDCWRCRCLRDCSGGRFRALR